jgi:hypothetical protein
VLATAVLGAACATTPIDATDPRYVKGVESFAANDWSDARTELDAFLEASCTPRQMRAAGCQKALWLKMRSDLAENLPAQAVEDALGYGPIGRPRRELSPSVIQLRHAARVEVATHWVSSDRSVQIQIVHDDEVGRAFHPLRVTYSIDGVRTLPVPEERWLTHEPVAYVSAPPGDHFVDVVCLYEQRYYAVRIGATRAFSAQPNDRVVIVTHINARPVAPTGRIAPIVDFEITAQPQRRPEEAAQSPVGPASPPSAPPSVALKSMKP